MGTEVLPLIVVEQLARCVPAGKGVAPPPRRVALTGKITRSMPYPTPRTRHNTTQQPHLTRMSGILLAYPPSQHARVVTVVMCSADHFSAGPPS